MAVEIVSILTWHPNGGEPVELYRCPSEQDALDLMEEHHLENLPSGSAITKVREVKFDGGVMYVGHNGSYTIKTMKK